MASGAIDHAGDVDVYQVTPSALDKLFFAVDADPERDGGNDLVIDLLGPDGSTVLLTVDSSTVPPAATGILTSEHRPRHRP